MLIFSIGDVVGSGGCGFLREHLPAFKKLKGVDLVIANGENAADGNGLTPAAADYLFSSGVDVVTTGNHAFRRKESYDAYEAEPFLLRPANFPSGAPGKGYCVVDKGRVQIGVVNLMGTVYLENLDCPFQAIDRILPQIPEAKVIIVDFHAEATAEKRAMGFYLDGRISALFGTHTHVQTADESILPEGTGYITDAGMTGPILSVLGVKPALAIEKMKSKLPVRFENAPPPCMLNGILFDVDDSTGFCQRVERINLQ